MDALGSESNNSLNRHSGSDSPTSHPSPAIVAMRRRVCENDQTAKTYAGAAEWLPRESAHL